MEAEDPPSLPSNAPSFPQNTRMGEDEVGCAVHGEKGGSGGRRVQLSVIFLLWDSQLVKRNNRGRDISHMHSSFYKTAVKC